MLSKIEIGFISNVLLKARILYLTILKKNRNWFYFKCSVESASFIFKNLKTGKFKLTFEGWNRPFCHLFGFTRVSFCQNLLNFTLGQWRESWRRWCRVSFSLFFSFSVSFKNSSPREKVGKLSLFWDWWAEFLFVSIIVAKRSDVLILLACTFGILSTLTYTEFDCVALLAML